MVCLKCKREIIKMLDELVSNHNEIQKLQGEAKFRRIGVCGQCTNQIEIEELIKRISQL